MRAHRNDVYRARRSRGKAWPVILWILAGLIVLAVILFYAGQKYIVYDSDGSLHVVFPIMETPAPVTEGGQPEVMEAIYRSMMEAYIAYEHREFARLRAPQGEQP